VFAEYLIPVAFSSEQLELHVSYNDVNLALSPVWYDGSGDVIAAALLAIREKRGWIGGFGVAPEYRGKGYARNLVDRLITVCRERGLERLTLEVLTENAAAIATYRSAGFEITRRLFCFETTIDVPHMPQTFAYASPDELIGRAQNVRPSWQREAASLRNGAVSTAVSDGDGTYAVFRHNAALSQVFKLDASDLEKFDALAQAVAFGYRTHRVMLLNEPEESPLVRLAQEAGWTQPFLQYEMTLSLPSPYHRERVEGRPSLSRA
jgi:predicted GNAT family N-acyltransferase